MFRRRSDARPLIVLFAILGPFVGLVSCLFFSESGATAQSSPPAVNVLAYGAACDGMTDDSAAVQAANDAAFALGASVVYPAGATCLVQGVHIKADQIGNGVTLRIPDGADNWMFNIAVDEIRISGFVFDGNKTNQPTPIYTENFDGFRKNSLIQAHALFRTVVVENNLFKDTQYGAMAFVDRTEFEGGVPQLIDRVVVRNNEFRDLGTEAVHAANPYDFKTIQGRRIFMNGTFEFVHNDARNVGTITEVAAPSGAFNQGTAVFAAGFRDVYISRNVIKHCARANYKFGGNNNYVITDNRSVDAHWVGVQIQTHHQDPVANLLPGTVLIKDNSFTTQFPPGIFVQLMGSASPESNHTVHPDVRVIDNAISHRGDDPQLLDAIQVTAAGKYARLEVKDNSFFNIRRAAVMVSLPYLDNFQMERVVIEDNLMRGSGGTSWNSLFLCQGSGNRIRRVDITDNIVVETQRGIQANTSPAEELLLLDNRVYDLGPGGYAMWFAGTQPLDSAVVRENFFDGKVEGFSALNLVWEDNNCATPQACQ